MMSCNLSNYLSFDTFSLDVKVVVSGKSENFTYLQLFF